VDDTPDRRVEAACEDREEHPPIRITEDHGPRGFTWTNPVTGEAEPRPGSGVTGGSGTAEDPFVIDGWCFAAPEGHGASPVAAPAVLVNGTQAHVVVEDNGFTGGTAERVRKQVGVHLEATRNVAVRSNAFAHVRTGVLVEGGQGGLVEENTVRFGSIAVEVRGAEQVRVEGNRLVNHLAGVLGEEAPGLVVASNEVRRMFHGVHVNASPGVHLAGNVLEDSVEYGGYVIRSRGAVLEGNLAVDHGDTGLVLGVSSDQAEVSGNTLRANGDAGLLVHDSDGVRVVENWMEANGVGVQVRDTAEALELRGNNLEDSREGVGVDASETELAVDARANWWGCPDGPGRDGCDGVNGDVVVDPWLTEPNPDAGAG
jgi:nitrous oxidase accessory protein NosD